MIRNIQQEVVDKSITYGFFDGSAQGNPPMCGSGAMLFLNEHHYIKFKEGLAKGTNNYA